MDPGQFGAVGGRDRRADRTVALSYTDAVTQTACWEERSQVCDEIRLTLAEVRRRTPSAVLVWGPRGTTPRLTVRGTTAGAPPLPPPPPPHLTSPHLTSPHLTSPHLIRGLTSNSLPSATLHVRFLRTRPRPCPQDPSPPMPREMPSQAVGGNHSSGRGAITRATGSLLHKTVTGAPIKEGGTATIKRTRNRLWSGMTTRRTQVLTRWGSSGQHVL